MCMDLILAKGAAVRNMLNVDDYRFMLPESEKEATDFEKAFGSEEDAGKKGGVRANLNEKGKTYLKKVERDLGKELAKSLNVPYAVGRDFIKPTVKGLADSYFENGKLEQNEVDRLFNGAYDEGRVVEREFYDSYKG